MSAEHLRYSGKVLAVEDTYAEIEIHEACGDGCGSCHLSSFCGGHGTSVMLKAEYDKDNAPAAGDRVVVAYSGTSSAKATLLLLVFPLVAFLAAAVGLSSAEISDLAVGASATGAALLCYGIVYLSGGRKKPSWYIVKKDI